MSDDSNDATVAVISDDEEDRPIKKLFKRLISNDSKQNTILTNNQIMDLLKIEYDINIFKLHDLEVDVYVTLVKKYLKDWPFWNEFDKITNEAQKNNDLASIEGKIQAQYENLKAFLYSAIETAAPMARQAVEKIRNPGITLQEKKGSKTSQVVMEIDATRQQLNTLFLQNPTPYSVFNINDQMSTIVVPETRKLETILNWWGMNIEISRRNYSTTILYRREICHELKHLLVNKMLPLQVEPIHLKQEVYVHNNKKSRFADKSEVLKKIEEIRGTPFMKGEILDILDFIQKDISLLPDLLFVSAQYKRYMNSTGYVRYLYKSNETTSNQKQYDIQLQETMSPMFKLYIGDIGCNSVLDDDCIKVECSDCNKQFIGVDIVRDLRVHFEEHCVEPDWTCTVCHKTFTMVELAASWWYHKCQM